MASYGARVRMVTTAEINRVLREGPYTRWAYFVDEPANKVGVIFANDTTFAAYAVSETPDPKLVEFGLEPIANLVGRSDPQFLVLTAGENEFQARVFMDPVFIEEDDFSSALTNDTLLDWQRFLAAQGIQRTVVAERNDSTGRYVMGGIIALIIIFVLLAIF